LGAVREFTVLFLVALPLLRLLRELGLVRFCFLVFFCIAVSFIVNFLSYFNVSFEGAGESLSTFIRSWH
jgi:hypothetical protein